MATYAFVDGRYLAACYRDMMSDLFGEPGELDPARLRRLLNADRVFYHDCRDETEQEK